jgi:predicted XRE-type DNA-binding protein
MLRVTEHFPGSLPTSVKPIWLEAYAFVDSDNSVWDSLLPDDDQEDITESMVNYATPKHMSRTKISTKVIVASSDVSHVVKMKQKKLTSNIAAALKRLKQDAKIANETVRSCTQSNIYRETIKK